MKYTKLQAAFIVAALSLSSGALAQDTPSDRVRGIKRLQLRPKVKARAKDLMKTRARDASEVAPEAAAKVEAVKRQLAAQGIDSDASKGAPQQPTKNEVARRARATEQRAALSRTLGPKLSGKWTPEMISAQLQHARRLAILERAQFLAQAAGDGANLERAARLERMERKRHAAWLDSYSSPKTPEPKATP